MTSTPSKTPSGLRNDSMSARILVVDDQPANIQVVGSVLGKLGHEIIPACDGPTALRRVALRPPDLILLDLLMPDMDGCEVCRRLKANPEWKDLPVIFLSAADDKECIARAFEAGGVDYITKPFNGVELVARVRTQLALKSAGDRLKQLVEDKDELMGILTHDLKNHLSGMQLSADILRDRRDSLDEASVTRLCENISRSNDRILAFVKEFLANAAAEHAFTPCLEAVDLGEAATQVVESFRVAAERKDLHLIISQPDQITTIQGDRAALNHILENLLSNAIKFSPPNKEIRVTVQPKGAFAECTIQDQGPGFTEEDKRQMFRRYVRLSARPTGNEPSTGLGLSIVRKLVDLMHGELICDSLAGMGATFMVRLPQVLGAPIEGASSPQK